MLSYRLSAISDLSARKNYSIFRLGVIAAALGAVAVPAMYKKDFTAITFLTLAAQQFRDVRKMERDTLTQIDSMELVSSGDDLY